MRMPAPAPGESMASAARDLIATHEIWDGPPVFAPIRYDGERLTLGPRERIDRATPIESYPQLLTKMAAAHVQAPDADQLYGYALRAEGYGVKPPGPDATAAQRARHHADRRTRSFHARPDAIELAFATCVDIHARVWVATKRRDTGQVDINFHPPRPDGSSPVGGMAVPAALLAIAAATGNMVHGLPLPWER